MLLVGSPVPGILTEMSIEESLDITRMYMEDTVVTISRTGDPAQTLLAQWLIRYRLQRGHACRGDPAVLQVAGRRS